MKKPIGYWLARISLLIFPTPTALRYVDAWEAPEDEEKVAREKQAKDNGWDLVD
jgi:hypothetical protein